MNYDLHGLSEILTVAIVFGALALVGWHYARAKDISDNSRTFR